MAELPTTAVRVNRHRQEDQPEPLAIPATATTATTASPVNNDNGTDEDTAPKLSSTSIALIMSPLCLSVFLSSLDLTILTPAIPSIVSSFSSATGYVWIGSAFVLTHTAVTPVWGSVADIWGRKPVILTALAIFLGGSLFCALAPTMEGLIAGRAIQGVGASGMGTMVTVIICDTFSMRDRGLYSAVTSVVWAVGSAVGPVIGGILTTNWRWCFWINLPIGAVVFVVLLLFLKVPTPNTPVLAGLKAIDWAGSLLIVGAALMILLGLDFGDVTYPWSSATVICLIAFGSAVVGIFILNEWKFAPNPLIPLRLFSNRSSVAAYGVFACNFYVLIGLSYYLPLYSQSALGANALNSGLHLLPLIVSSSLAAACAGVFIQQTGIYLPVMYVAQVMLTLGTGLFINLELQESLAKLFIFEIITGIGIGMNMEPPPLAAMAATTVLDTAAVVTSMAFVRSLATAIAIVLGGVIFQNRMDATNDDLVDQLGQQLAGNFTGGQASTNIELITSLPTDQQVLVRRTSFGALRTVWIMYVVVAGLSLISNFFVRAHHLSDEIKALRLGVGRTRRDEPQHDQVANANPIELDELGENGTR
ncbi:major facilitator superfamily domain-containing protein [Pseudomassariella vexata]|uniref:Major facilitator superfamily domain-containing protein n=1 Tax=Pseudomassariella vexata TaxID=1141098 RepID=A0A1Y2EHW2_9PEZI|nr:major facilitator superfamily domain-containing protein [Pseudomassariella vexata]ORY71162.1 major facilitator superfamily domain-containing protein [Pseudomassariella vexata]